MMQRDGSLERNFQPEGKIKDNVVAMPIYRSSLWHYCLRMPDSVLIVGNGGVKSTRSYEQDKELMDTSSVCKN